jgi:hypothetical protein
MFPKSGRMVPSYGDFFVSLKGLPSRVSGHPGQNPGGRTPMSRIPTPAAIDVAPAASHLNVK